MRALYTLELTSKIKYRMIEIKLLSYMWWEKTVNWRSFANKWLKR